jgi:hypothetical protein
MMGEQLTPEARFQQNLAEVLKKVEADKAYLALSKEEQAQKRAQVEADLRKAHGMDAEVADQAKAA